MDNKVLVKIIVPEIDFTCDVFLPANEIIWKIKKLLVNSISSVSRINLDINKTYLLINKYNNNIYDDNQVLIDSDIRNASELFLISV